ncbi:MAG TPA: TIGR00375 family protein [Methanobacteriaceae archaeon]|nr:TIGR00375 family protein [Methanobacteriaceae archaeon]
MIIRADLHVHGRYSMATSKNMVPTVIASQARLKGLNLVGTGDAFHGAWLELIDNSTEELAEGIYIIPENKRQEEDSELASENSEPLLILTAEVEDMKRVHHLLILPSIKTAHQMRQHLKGNLDSDGRPRVRMSGGQIQKLAREYGCLMGPSHAFTPWTSIYKAYDSIYDCYDDKPDFVELGLSADTDMADRVEELQDLPFLTNSDAHSPWPHRLGREFNEIEVNKIDYTSLEKAFKGLKMKANYGFDPRMGKYHLTACSKCYQLYPVKKALELNMKCPCGGTIKKGVDYRVEELATWDEPHHPLHRPPYIHILPLAEIISLVYSKGVTTVFVQKIWKKMVQMFGDEISVLITAPLNELNDLDPKIMPVIKSFRDGTLKMRPGGGGRYGEIIFEEEKGVNKEKDKDENTLDKYF